MLLLYCLLMGTILICVEYDLLSICLYYKSTGGRRRPVCVLREAKVARRCCCVNTTVLFFIRFVSFRFVFVLKNVPYLVHLYFEV